MNGPNSAQSAAAGAATAAAGYARLRELHVTLEAGIRQRETVLGQIAQNLADWNLQVSREKAVYHTLNKLSIDVTRKCLIAEGWCPTVARRRLVDAIDRATYQSSAQVRAHV